MQHVATRPWTASGIALIGAGLIAAAPVAVPAPGVYAAAVALTAGEQITLDLVRHGQSADNVAAIIGTVAPGAPLTATGEQQADDVATAINQEFPNDIAGIYASGLIRTQETAAPLAQLLGLNVTDLSGLNELNAGTLEGISQNDLTGLLYLAAPLLWTLGQYWVPEVGSSDYNGMAFEDRFSDAVQTIYNNTIDDPDGQLTGVAFSHAAAIMTWVMMNVDNPNPLLMLTDPLDNTGQVVLQGNPTDGWTLVSWNGQDVPEASLLTSLFVDFRDLITAPQMAAYDIQVGLLNTIGTESLTPLLTALQTGISDVVSAIVQFPQAVIDSIIGGLGDAGSSAQATADALAALF